jgi:hypothetical protein
MEADGCAPVQQLSKAAPVLPMPLLLLQEPGPRWLSLLLSL